MVIGKARFVNVEDFMSWLTDDENQTWGYTADFTQEFKEQRHEYNIKDKSALYISPYCKKHGETNEKKAKAFYDVVSYSDKTGIPFQLIYTDNDSSIVKYGRTFYDVPTMFLEIELFADYSDVNVDTICNKNGMETGNREWLPAADTDKTIHGVNDSIRKKEAEVEKIKEATKKMEEEMEEEIRRLEAEIKEKYRSRREELSKKREELHSMIEKMNQELFMLETNIYGIRCFMGEVVDFYAIRSGRRADIEAPIIINQKVRYLDEELGKLAGMYDLAGTSYEQKMFEKILEVNDYIAELFAPGEKSINLVKVSRNKTGYVCVNRYGETILSEYEKLHGGMMAILVRDGGNLYIGWTDEEKISISSEDLYYVPKETQYDQVEEDLDIQTSSRTDVVSRYFIFSIIQGLVYDGRLLRIPETESVFAGGGKYIVFTKTDGFIEDNRFGNFSDIMDRCKVNIQEGDMILCVSSVHGFNSESKYRGVGYYTPNRIHDCNLEDNKIYKVNKIEKKNKVETHVKTINPFDGREGNSKSMYSYPLRSLNLDVSSVWVMEEVEVEKKQYFVSLEKTWSYSGARANFMVYEDEMVNLTFLNSVWLKYAIQNRKVGSWYIRGKVVDYAYSIKYLNKMLEHILKREEKEIELISKYVSLPDEWPILLSEWKLSHNVHHITDYQAKRFAKTIMG